MNLHETELVVRYAETDQMGIAHHSNYAVWFEAARTEYIKSLGISYTRVEELGLMLPLKSLHCEYIKPAKYEDVIKILTKVKESNGVRLSFSYTVLNKEDGTPDLWFSDSPQHITQAKAICHGCADQLPCLAGAMQRRETHGIWGGTDLNPDHRQEDVA